MWMLFVRSPPDAPYWEGRRWFAAADALAWPALWALVALNLPVPGGIVSAAGVALAGVAAWWGGCGWRSGTTTAIASRPGAGRRCWRN